MTSYPLRSARIGTRLAACFVMIALAMLVADVVAVWLFRMTAAPAEQLAKADRISLAVIRVHFDIDTFKDNLAALASTRGIRRFKTEGALLREKFLEDVAHQSHATVRVRLARGIDGDDPGALLAAVLQRVEAEVGHSSGVVTRRDSDDSAHGQRPSMPRVPSTRMRRGIASK